MHAPLPRSIDPIHLRSAENALAAAVLSRPDAAWGLIPAAGIGSRAGPGLPKQYRDFGVEARSVLDQAVEALARGAEALGLGGVLVVLAPDDVLWNERLAGTEVYSSVPIIALRAGGAERAATVAAGLAALAEVGLSEQAWVAVHDAARPGLPVDALQRLAARLQALNAAESPQDGALLALPVADTLQRASPEGGFVAETVSRDGLWAAQTPQAFRLGPLRQALACLSTATDEASAIRAAGGRAYLVEGSPANRKLTRPDDFLDS